MLQATKKSKSGAYVNNNATQTTKPDCLKPTKQREQAGGKMTTTTRALPQHLGAHPAHAQHTRSGPAPSLLWWCHHPARHLQDGTRLTPGCAARRGSSHPRGTGMQLELVQSSRNRPACLVNVFLNSEQVRAELRADADHELHFNSLSGACKV